jgi:hypothetical protein
MEHATIGHAARRTVESSRVLAHGGALERSLASTLLVLAVRFLYGSTAMRLLEFLSGRAATRLLTLVVLVALAGCVPVSEQPAGDEHAPFDTRLQGMWRPVGDDDAQTILFVSAADEAGRGARLLAVEEAADRRWKVDDYSAVTARRGSHGYLSVRYSTTDGARRGWVIARYTLVTGDRLRLETLDEKRLAVLVRAGTLAGRVNGDEPGADVDLTLSSAELLTFLDSPEGARLFSAPHVLARVASPGGTRRARTHHQKTGTGVAPTPSR